MASDSADRSLTVRMVAVYLFFSGGYHLLDGALKLGGAGDRTLNILFAVLSVVLGVGLLLSAGGLVRYGSGNWYLGAGLVTLCTVLLDTMGVMLTMLPAYGLDAILLLAGLVLVVRSQSSTRTRADMDEDESVHSIGRDYP